MSAPDGEGEERALGEPQVPGGWGDAARALAEELAQTRTAQAALLEGIRAVEEHLVSMKGLALGHAASLRGMEAHLAELTVAASGARPAPQAARPAFVPRAAGGPWALRGPEPCGDDGEQGAAAVSGGGGGSGAAGEEAAARGAPARAAGAAFTPEPLHADEGSDGEAEAAAEAAAGGAPEPSPRAPRRVQPVAVASPASPSPRGESGNGGAAAAASSGAPSPAAPSASPAEEAARQRQQQHQHQQKEAAPEDEVMADVAAALAGASDDDEAAAAGGSAEEVVIAGPTDTAFHYVLQGGRGPAAWPGHGCGSQDGTSMQATPRLHPRLSAHRRPRPPRAPGAVDGAPAVACCTNILEALQEDEPSAPGGLAFTRNIDV
jgi:hypothetical protein